MIILAAEKTHDAEKLYMEQLRNIETVIYSFSEKKNTEIYNIKRLRARFQEISDPPEPTWSDAADSAVYYGAGAHVEMIICIFFIALIFFGVAGIEKSFPFWNQVGLGCSLTSIIWAVVLMLKIIKEKEELDSKYYDTVKQNRKRNETNEVIYERNILEADDLQKKVDLIDTSLAEAVKIRDDLYSVNWIPTRYRNIKAIYYIYDMVSTSEITIEEALKYFLLQEANNRLDVILKKMDDIIEHQREIVMNQ